MHRLNTFIQINHMLSDAGTNQKLLVKVRVSRGGVLLVSNSRQITTIEYITYVPFGSINSSKEYSKKSLQKQCSSPVIQRSAIPYSPGVGLWGHKTLIFSVSVAVLNWNYALVRAVIEQGVWGVDSGGRGEVLCRDTVMFSNITVEAGRRWRQLSSANQ